MLREKKFLHIITRPPAGFVVDFLNEPFIKKASCIVLAGDGVYSEKISAKNVYQMVGDAKARGINIDGEEISYKKLVELIFENERVYVW